MIGIGMRVDMGWGYIGDEDEDRNVAGMRMRTMMGMGLAGVMIGIGLE